MIKDEARNVPAKPIRYINESEASVICGLSVAYLQKARWKGNGPPYIKISRSVRYAEHDLLAWLQSKKRS